MKVKSTYLSAGIVLLGIVVWISSGVIERKYFVDEAASKSVGEREEAKNASVKDDKQSLVKVRYRLSKASVRKQFVAVKGRTEVKRRVVVKAETSGKINKIFVAKGDRVKKGDLLCELEIGAKNANLAQSKALYAQAMLDFEVTNALAAEGHLAKNRKTAIKAKLDAAKAQVVLAELNIKRTKIFAPYGGVIEGEPAVLGELLQPGSRCATLVEIDPVVVAGFISERQVGLLDVGDEVEVRFITGEMHSAKVTYIAPVAEVATRTFRIEVEMPNTNFEIKSGISAAIKISLKNVMAHQFSSAILSLDDEGRLGVKTLDEKDRVHFNEVNIIDDVSGEGILVTGMDEIVRVITVGQEYVNEGQGVNPIEE